MGLFDRLKERLAKTREAISDRITGLFKGGRPIDDALLKELEELLWTSDVGPLASELCAELGRLHRRGEVKGEDDVRGALRRMLLERLGPGSGEIALSQKPTVVLVVGVNGSGKTTSIAKLAHRFQQQGKKVLLGAGDTFRAAAADQLEVWARRNGAEIVRQQKDGADPAGVAWDAVEAGIARGADVVIIDTAGRLHTQSNLMDELRKVRRVIEKRLPGAPHETLLVLDATVGRNALSQENIFGNTAGVTGIVMTKLDGTARGGVLVPVAQASDAPIKLIGVGEGIEDLQPFDAVAFSRSLVGLDGTENP